MPTQKDIDKIKRISLQKCQEWMANPTKNPLTGQPIRSDTKTRGIYHELQEACFRKYGISVGNASARPAVVLPKTVMGIRVPTTQAEWQTLFQTASEYVAKIKDFTFYILDDSQKLSGWKKLFELGAKYEVYKTQPADKLIADLDDILRKEKREMNFHGVVLRFDDVYKKVISKIFLHPTETNDTYIRILKEYKEMAEFHSYLHQVQHPQLTKYFPAAINFDDMFDQLIQLDAVFEEIELAKVRDNPYSLDASRSRKTPSSLSSSSSRSRKFDSSYRGHKALSEMSPVHGSLSPLPEKTRQQILKELKQACLHMKDFISMENFSRMPKKSLQLIIQLGNTDKKRCYYVRNLYNLWKQAKHDNKKLVDPMRNPITKEEQDVIMKKVRYLDPRAKDLRDSAPTQLKITLQIDNVKHRVRVGESQVEVPFFKISVERKIGKYVVVVHDLGYVPADIEPSDLGGALNLSSAVIISNIRELFDKGRLMASNVIPYRCCRIHLRKPIDYWIDMNDSKFIDKNKLRLMAEEIDQFL